MMELWEEVQLRHHINLGTLEEAPNLYWRAEAFVYLFDGVPCQVTLNLRDFRVLRETPRTVVLDIGYPGQRRCVKGAWRSFAHATKAEAIRAWRARFNWRKHYAEQEMQRINAIEEFIKEMQL